MSDVASVASTLIPIFNLVFVVSSMLGVGFSLTMRMIAQCIKPFKVAFLALIANFVVIPIVVISVSLLVFLPEDVEIGFIILSFAAGAAFTPKLAQFAKASIALAVGLMTVLMVATVIVLPLVLPLIIPGVGITPLAIAEPLILSMLFPLGIALAIRYRYKGFAERASTMLNPVATVSLLVLLSLFFIAYWNLIIDIGLDAILFAIFFVLFGLVVGYLLGLRNPEARRVSSLAAAQRNISAGLIVALTDFAVKPVVGVTVLVTSIVGLILLIIVAMVWGHKGEVK